jgi:predicted alpha/beta superfamily hydrolase
MRRSLFLLPLLLLGCGGEDPETNNEVPIVDSQSFEDTTPSIDSAVVEDTFVGDTAPSETPPSTKTVIHVHYPAAGKTIALRGSIAPWNWDKGVAMKPEADDTWTVEADIKSDAEYKPLLDDATWARGPNYKIKAGTTVDIYPHFTQVKGKFEKRWPAFASKSLKTRGVYVYYPPTYLENTRAKFPVVYMHDGQNLFDASTAFGGNEWKVDETMDAAAEDGSIREAIVVGPENTADRMYEYTPTKNASYPSSGGGDVYLAFLVDELKPKVDAELRTLPARETTVVMGSSLGGLISAYAGVKKPTTFGLIGAMSPSTWWDNKAILKIVEGTTDKPLKVYVDSGDSGASSDDRDNTKLLADTYKTLGFVEGSTLKYVVQSGATHSEVYWAQRLPGALAFLLGAAR